MDSETQKKIQKISRYLWAYGAILALGVLWSIADGSVENVRDFIRGIVRSAVMFYLAKTIWDLRKVSWWVMAISCCVFSVFGVISAVLLFAGGVLGSETKYIYTAIIIVPTVLLLIRAFLLVIQSDVRQKFVN